MTVRRDGLFFAAVWFLTAVGQASVGPEAEVKLVAGRVRIKATATAISTVLDRLSRTTGMKVVYEGAPPSDRLTVAIDAGSETEALSRLLEGLGLTYAFKLDAAGRHVETLFVTTSSSSRRASSSPSRTPAPVMLTPLVDQDVDDPSMAENSAATENDPALQQGEASGMVAGNPGYAGGLPLVGGTPGADDQAPGFPEAASFPSSFSPGSPFPVAPVAPGPASFPSPNVGL